MLDKVFCHFIIYMSMLAIVVFSRAINENGTFKISPTTKTVTTSNIAKDDAIIPSTLEKHNLSFNTHLPKSTKKQQNIKSTYEQNSAIVKLQENAKHMHRLKREFNYVNPETLDTPVDKDFDMELAEINVFRPVFRYRVAYSRQVKNRRQQFS